MNTSERELDLLKFTRGELRPFERALRELSSVGPHFVYGVRKTTGVAFGSEPRFEGFTKVYFPGRLFLG